MADVKTTLNIDDNSNGNDIKINIQNDSGAISVINKNNIVTKDYNILSGLTIPYLLTNQQIKDSITANDSLWSSTKIQAELNNISGSGSGALTAHINDSAAHGINTTNTNISNLSSSFNSHTTSPTAHGIDVIKSKILATYKSISDMISNAKDFVDNDILCAIVNGKHSFWQVGTAVANGFSIRTLTQQNTKTVSYIQTGAISLLALGLSSSNTDVQNNAVISHAISLGGQGGYGIIEFPADGLSYSVSNIAFNNSTILQSDYESKKAILDISLSTTNSAIISNNILTLNSKIRNLKFITGSVRTGKAIDLRSTVENCVFENLDFIEVDQGITFKDGGGSPFVSNCMFNNILFNSCTFGVISDSTTGTYRNVRFDNIYADYATQNAAIAIVAGNDTRYVKNTIYINGYFEDAYISLTRVFCTLERLVLSTASSFQSLRAYSSALNITTRPITDGTITFDLDTYTKQLSSGFIHNAYINNLRATSYQTINTVDAVACSSNPPDPVDTTVLSFSSLQAGVYFYRIWDNSNTSIYSYGTLYINSSEVGSGLNQISSTLPTNVTIILGGGGIAIRNATNPNITFNAQCSIAAFCLGSTIS